MDAKEMADRYERRRILREAKLRDFFDPNGATQYLIVQHAGNRIYGACNSIADIVRANLLQFEEAIAVDWTDDLPYLEPWIGTGVYANAFGCDYVFRDFDAPHVHYKYQRIDEVKNIACPDWKKSPVMNMVLDTIDALKEATNAGIPISLTDTQSAFDTATLILDAAEFFTACYADEEAVIGFMKKLNDLIIDFSHVQMKRIGNDILALPGHIMPGMPTGTGISISDDNLAVSSPHINNLISLPFDQILADEFGGLAIHSCGTWAHTMALLRNYRNITMIDCAVGRGAGDPNPNDPAAVRDALAGTGIIAKIRPGGDRDDLDRTLEEIFHPDLKLVVQIPYSKDNEESNYRFVDEKLRRLYHGSRQRSIADAAAVAAR
ncbi:MAG: uroporphyrinogen decarboxylase family protein [Spirochaetota bacterium]|mgnify:CR=1